ncbi:PREDICTED: uncharacterized protein LOC105622256 [Atta cephalotes]|uniref:Uncharacterized protein n=1 Tax=Atta cephalotes TaxID=12957 RepID=A0A158NNF8_ATTCE|nr:PREDICTED: uncharacterized protein LOC105622256 [Atta cephalotes]
MGSALRCWVCSSNVNIMCNDPMNTTDHQAAFHIKTCDPGPYGSSKPICRKIVKREYGERIIIRQCSTPYHDEIDIIDGQCGNSMIQPRRDVIESCHICSSDLCNSATTISAMKLLYIIGRNHVIHSPRDWCESEHDAKKLQKGVHSRNTIGDKGFPSKVTDSARRV